MRPSISVSLEPGLERGVPWGRDLYTFVTSAAGHMMRTLQKPRKNRPSKRQVNHRRFLHNMIQRQFADIEAANHRLASTLYFREDEKNSAPSQKPKTFEQSGSPSKDSQSKSDISVGSQETEISRRKQPDSGHLCKQVPKSQRTTCTDPKNDQSSERRGEETEIRNRKLVEFTSLSSLKVPQFGAKLFQTECYDPESQLKSTSHLAEDSTQQDFIHFGQNVDISPPFSPDLSPLSLDSCDFSIQMLTDVSACAQKSIADISETQWTDIMDLFSSKDLGGCLDVDPYFESICACQGDDEQEVFAGGSFSSRSEVQDIHGDTGELRFEYRCHGGQGLTSNQALRQTENAAETQFNRFKSNHETDIIQNQLQTSSSYNYNSSELHTYQHPPEQSSCMLGNGEIIQNFTPFEGVAQYFSVPLHNTEDRPIPTPPQEDDWLFTDILKDRKSPNC